MSFADLGADSKLASGLGMLTVIVLLAVGFVAVEQAAIDGELQRTLAASAADARGAEQLDDRFGDLARLRSRLSVDDDAKTKATTREGLDAAARDAAALLDAALRSAPGSAARIERARQGLTDVSRLGDDTAPLRANGLVPGGGVDSAPTVSPDESAREMRSLRGEIEDAIQLRSEGAFARTRDARAFLIETLGALLVAASALTFIALRLGLNIPIQALASALRSAAATAAQAPLPGLDRKDEVGQIARGLEAAKAAIVATMSADADQGARLQRSEAEASAVESLRAEDRHSRTLSDLGAAMKTLAAGDLTVRLGDSLSSDGAPLARHFDSALNSMTKVVRAFAMSADAVQSRSRDISTSSNDMIERGEQQLQAVAKASEALSSIAARSSETADGVARTCRDAAILDEEAEESAARTQQATEAFEIFAISAERVSGMTTLVDEVAFQTTLLALNASVEAARAGDVGRGIAVVALELRALAQRSTQAAREFDAGFSASTKQIRKGVALLAETGAAMDRIKQRTAAIRSTASAIGAGVSDQSNELREVRAALDRIGAGARQNAKTAERMDSASQSVDELIGKLSGLIRRSVGEQRTRDRAREGAVITFQSKSS